MKPLILLSIVFLAGCFPPPTPWIAEGGSKADGTVKLLHEYSRFNPPIATREQALALAKSKCEKWGYADAEEFGAVINTCLQINGFGECNHTRATAEFQCINPK